MDIKQLLHLPLGDIAERLQRYQHQPQLRNRAPAIIERLNALLMLLEEFEGIRSSLGEED